MSSKNKKAFWIVNIGGKYLPELMSVTLVSFKAYAHKIGADLNIITDRMFPDWSPTYEKSQVYFHGRDYDWNIVSDADLLLHPDFPDLTQRVPEFAVGVMDGYLASSRFAANPYFLRDQRNFGISGLFNMAPKACFDFWTPLPGTQKDYLGYIRPDPDEIKRGVPPEHFITEYWLSNNVARFGLKYTGLLHEEERKFYHHPYGKIIDGKFHSFTDEEKTRGVRERARSWGLIS